MPLPSPVKPSFSSVVALTLICDCALAIQDFNEQNGRVPGIDENAGKILECAQEISMEA